MTGFNYSEYNYLISIDIGATHSGVCYTYTSQLNDGSMKNIDIIHVMDWPEQKGRKLLKIPTACIYKGETGELFKWGADAFKYWHDNSKSQDNLKYIEKFKLKFQATKKGEQILLENDDESLHVKATKDFLKAIYEYTFMEMESVTVEKGTIDKNRIRFVLTVPAQWTDDDRKLLRLICIEAGLITEMDHENRLHIINESFAAAIYCGRQLATSKNEIKFAKGDRYLICDAGGGTVDLATYECTGPDEELNGLCNGHRQLAFDRDQDGGAALVDEKMRDLLLDIVFVEKEEREQYKDIFGSLLQTFIDEIKPNFDGIESDDDDSNVYFRISNVLIRKLSRSSKSQSKYFGPEKFDDEYFNFNEALKKPARIHYITISKQEIAEKVFDKVVADTLRLVKRQIERSNYNITSTFLLGGFGKSPYLQKRLGEKREELQTGEIIVDSDGESAVMRGALIYGASLS